VSICLLALKGSSLSREPKCEMTRPTGDHAGHVSTFEINASRPCPIELPGPALATITHCSPAPTKRCSTVSVSLLS
jgi:hypothetical protein